MAHKKGGGTKAGQGGNVSGKRLGVKVYGNGVVKPGQIIVRQRGREFISGRNTDMGKDFTIFSKVDGLVKFKWQTKTKKKIDVIPSK